MRARSLLVASLVCSACGGGGDEQQLVVLAASSLTDVFDRLGDEFEAVHPGTDVVVSSGGSSSLAGQIEQGAPADVFASADEPTMARVLDDAAGEPVVFARNRLAIAVESGNPEGIVGLSDLAADDLIVVLADADVPAGAYAAELLSGAGVEVGAASLESSVRAVAAKVALGEADAGIVYRTDIVANRDRLDEVPISDEQNVIADYPIVVVGDSRAAGEFVEFVLGAAGRAALVDAGFELP